MSSARTASLGTAPSVHDQLRHGRQAIPYLAVLTGMAWSQGLVGVLVKVIALPPLVMVCARCVIAAAVLAGVAFATGRSVGRGWRTVFGVVITSLLLAAHWATLFWAYRLTDVALVIVGIFTFPVMVAIAEPLCFRTRISRRQVVGGLLVVAGVAVLDRDAAGGQPLTGLALAVLSAACFAARNIISRGLQREGDGIALMAWQSAIAALILAPAMADPALASASMRDWALVLLLGLVFTALYHTLGVVCLARLSVATTGILGAQQVPSGIILAWLVLGEDIGWRTALGAGLVIAATVWESLARLRARPELGHGRLGS